MNQVFTIYSIFFLAAALLSFFVALLAWQRRSVKGARELTWLTVYLFRFIAGQPGTFRSQGVVVFFAGLCPWIASALYLTGINPVPGLDITPFSIILSATFLAYAIL